MSDIIKVGLIGAGGRGTGAAFDCVHSSKNVEIVAVGDLFPDRLDSALTRFKSQLPPGICKFTPDTCFHGFDAYEKVLATDCNYVILGSPPHFRPRHLKAAIDAGKHVFMEKPVAVDPAGVRSVIESSALAGEKGLGIVAGTQRRHQHHYREMIRRIEDGEIGELLGGRCYWNQGFLWVHDRQPNYNDMEWQCRNWLYFTWLSGDHICEQHVHNLDVINWAMGGPPTECMGLGGREVRKGERHGNIFDHFTVEYTYPNGATVMSMCRQIAGASSRVSETLTGTKGRAYSWSGGAKFEDGVDWQYRGPSPNPYVQEHANLIQSIRDGEPLNEGKRIAESTMTAIIGRMSAYTGRALKFSWAMKASRLDLTPPHYEFKDLAYDPVAVPGVTKLV